jgi:hypothetical protein
MTTEFQAKPVAQAVYDAFVKAENSTKVALVKAALKIHNEPQMIEVLSNLETLFALHPSKPVRMSEFRAVFKASIKLGGETAKAELEGCKSYAALIDYARSVNNPPKPATASSTPAVLVPGTEPATNATGTAVEPAKRAGKVTDKQLGEIQDKVKLSTVTQAKEVLSTLTNNLAARHGGEDIILDQIAAMAAKLLHSQDNGVKAKAEAILAVIDGRFGLKAEDTLALPKAA